MEKLETRIGRTNSGTMGYERKRENRKEKRKRKMLSRNAIAKNP